MNKNKPAQVGDTVRFHPDVTDEVRNYITRAKSTRVGIVVEITERGSYRIQTANSTYRSTRSTVWQVDPGRVTSVVARRPEPATDEEIAQRMGQ